VQAHEGNLLGFSTAGREVAHPVERVPGILDGQAGVRG